MKFDQLGLSTEILKALKDKSYETPTPIQEKAIPLILQKKDVLGCAQTGTGKTAAFAIPIIQLINEIKATDNKTLIRSLIVTPTRELAIQIDDNIKAYCKYTSLRHTVIFGGVKQHKQVQQLKGGVDILTATPGRLLDLIGQGYISLSEIKLFVLDEADRMLDMGFIHDVNKLLKLVPEKRQSLFFSATMPDSIVKLSNKILNNPVKVEVAAVSSAAETIQQFIYYTNKSTKRNLLLHILENPDIDQVLVFTRTKHGADRVTKHLKQKNIPAAAIHGDKAQNQRQKALSNFKTGKIRVMVATDIAARGIDIDKLKYVINYEVPNLEETYVHRIGRSGRAGEEGIAISLCEPEENAYVKSIERLIKKKLQIIEDNPFPQTDKPMTDKEKKEFEKEKNRRKQEFFANRKKNRENGGGRNSGGRNGGGNKAGRRKNNDRPKKSNNDNRSQNKDGNAQVASKDNNNTSKPKAKNGQRREGQRNEGRNKNPRNNNQKDGNKKSDQKKGNKNRSKKPYNKKSRAERQEKALESLKSKYMWPLEK